MATQQPFDHWRLVLRRKREVGRFVALLKQAQGSPGVHEHTVEHEADNRCCKREPWPVTMTWLHGQAELGKTLYVNPYEPVEA